MKSFAIVLLCIVTCVAYGIIHDQITARICLEYFTIGHPRIFATTDPTLLALGWGIVATWWVGLLLGIPLACACRLGRWPKREVRTLVRPLLTLAGCSFGLAILAGAVGGMAAYIERLTLVHPFAEMIPAHKHDAFLIVACAHNASYSAGFVGGVILIVSVLRQRRRQYNRES